MNYCTIEFSILKIVNSLNVDAIKYFKVVNIKAFITFPLKFA